MDPAAVWEALPAPADSPLDHVARPRFADMVDILRAAPIVRDGDGGFQLHPRGDKAPLRAWRWIAAVRDGCPVVQPGCTEVEQHMINALVEPIVDLAAISLDLQRILGTMCGVATVLGTPQEYGWTEAIRLRRSPHDWIKMCGHGAVLLKPAGEAAEFLRGFERIVADDVKHGEQVHAALRRAYQGPTIMVRS